MKTLTKIKITTLLLCMVALLFVSCKKKNKEPQYETDVYVAGYVWDEDKGDNTRAKVWKNGKELYDLTNGDNSCWAFSVFVTDNDDVYVAGNEQTLSPRRMDAKVWKNGVVQYTIEDIWWDWTASVYVSGSDVYLAGSKKEGGQTRGMLWKNGVKEYSLSSGAVESMARSVYVSGSDVYVAGYMRNSDRGAYDATIWKNGEKLYSLIDGTKNSYASSLYVHNGNVYVAGYEYNGSTHVAKLWVNDDEAHTLATDARALSVYVSDGNVYVAGFISGEAAFWKNQVPTKLTNDASRWEDAHSVYVHNGDVYVAGNGAGKAAVWKNNVPTYLTDTDMDSEGVAANSVFVTQRVR